MSKINLAQVAMLADALYQTRPCEREHALYAEWISLRHRARNFVTHANEHIDPDAFEGRATHGRASGEDV